MGAWIEIAVAPVDLFMPSVAPHDGCVDWNFYFFIFFYSLILSHPTMGAWIEIAPVTFM